MLARRLSTIALPAIQPYHVILALALVLFIAQALVIPATSPASPNWNCDCDHVQYYALASGQPVHAPFVWRLLEPALARMSGIPLAQAFPVLTLFWLALLGPVVYYALRSARFSPTYAAIGVLLVYSLWWITGYNLSDPYLADPPAIVFLTLAIAFAYRRQASLFMLTLAVGVLAREAVLVAIPVWFMLAGNHRFSSTLRVALPALIVFGLLRVVLVDPTYSMLKLPGIVAAWRMAHPAGITEYLPYGVLPILALFDRRNWRVLVVYGPMLIVVYMQMAIGSDTGRLLVIGFLPWLIMGLNGVQAIVARVRFVLPAGIEPAPAD